MALQQGIRTENIRVRVYNVIHWSSSGMAFWVVSDLSITELRGFAKMAQN